MKYQWEYKSGILFIGGIAFAAFATYMSFEDTWYLKFIILGVVATAIGFWMSRKK